MMILLPTQKIKGCIFSFPVKSGPHSCCCCKATVEKSRPVNKSLALVLGLKDEDMANDFPRVCNSCYMKSQRKKHGHCPIPTCTSTKGRNKGRLRHMPGKWTDLPKDVREAIANELRKYFNFKICLS